MFQSKLYCLAVSSENKSWHTLPEGPSFLSISAEYYSLKPGHLNLRHLDCVPFEGRSPFHDILDKFIKWSQEEMSVFRNRIHYNLPLWGLLPPLNEELPITLPRLHLQSQNLALPFRTRLWSTRFPPKSPLHNEGTALTLKSGRHMLHFVADLWV